MEYPGLQGDRHRAGSSTWSVMQGEFHWYKHDEQDEFFFVLDGLFRIELNGADTVELGPRQAFTVPAKMLHRPVVPVRSAVLMIEKAGVVATGD
ncbi:cupin domain-containing protein [Actinomadura sp.]|uniref:cupin domain-containing protein n=2 Tax=Actinomadura sp. TaxID=1989 RepID=UPI0037C8204E